MAVPARVTLITLGVTDVQASGAFYERLGWRRSSSSQKEVVFLRLHGAHLSLFGAADLAEDAAIEPRADHGFRGISLAINVASREEVDRVYGEWIAAGATVLRSPEAAFWGGYRGYVADPDGHAWEIAHNPFWPLDDAGFAVLPE